MSLVVVFEKEDSVILVWQILEFIPLSTFETFKSLILPKFLS